MVCFAPCACAIDTAKKLRATEKMRMNKRERPVSARILVTFQYQKATEAGQCKSGVPIAEGDHFGKRELVS